MPFSDGLITSYRRSSIEAAEKLGTRSEPLIIVVMNCLPDSANSHVIHAATQTEHKVVMVIHVRKQRKMAIRYESLKIRSKLIELDLF